MHRLLWTVVIIPSSETKLKGRLPSARHRSRLQRNGCVCLHGAAPDDICHNRRPRLPPIATGRLRSGRPSVQIPQIPCGCIRITAAAATARQRGVSLNVGAGIGPLPKNIPLQALQRVRPSRTGVAAAAAARVRGAPPSRKTQGASKSAATNRIEDWESGKLD